MTAPPSTDRSDRATKDKPADHNSPEWASDSNPDIAKNNSISPFDKAVSPPPIAGRDEDEQRFTLSATQVMASMAAAVTAALVGSKLGVAGTVIGAGIASVISVVGGAIFGHSILLTRRQVRRAVLQVRGADDAGPPAPRASLAAVTTLERAEPGRPRPTRRRLGTGLLLGVAATAAIFASSLGAVTLIETIKGSPLGGGVSGGLSVLGGNGGTANEVPAAATTAVVTEQVTVTSTVTPEVTTTAPGTPTQSSDAAPLTSGSTATTESSSGSAPSTESPSTESPSTESPSPSAANSSIAESSGTVGAGAVGN